MASKLLFLVPLFVVFSTGFSANTCRIGTVVNRQVNNQTYSFPTHWNESHSAPHLAADQSCSWVITVPQGYYVKLIMSGRINDSVGHFQTVDGNGNIVMTQHEIKEPYYFPSPKFTLIVNNEAPATFAFEVIWAPFPTAIAYDAGIGSHAHIVNITQDIFAAEFSCEISCSLLAFPADVKHHYTLRSVLIFSGNDFNGKYLTNLFQVYNTRTQMITPNTVIYIVNLEASGVLDQLLVQSAQYTQDLDPYKELSCDKTGSCSKFLGGGTGKSGLVYVGNQNQTLTSISMDQTATLSVYYGSQAPFFFYQTYNGSSIQSMLPLTFEGGYMTNYIVSSGKSTLTFTFSG
ncbi:hypothetical protein CAEBREN_24672 [Caenorhabditis brenneri]|uniref:Uncharacterized protein n=1 Tax=Caenorhabditis brenneri TaxID=135651 RepID=G0N5B0_CAEBE|nr:hypothetical protein CAEBREN_24672 [Caenorhabditis brenneri]